MVRTLGVSLDLLLAVSMGVDQKELIKFHCGWMLDCLLGLISSSPLGLFYFVVFLGLSILGLSYFLYLKRVLVTIERQIMIMINEKNVIFFLYSSSLILMEAKLPLPLLL